MKRRNRTRFHAILSSPLTFILLLIVFFFIGRSALKIYLRAAESAARLEEVRANLAKNEAKQSDLRAKIGSISTKEGVEASIREKYHAVEPGESVAIIVNTDAAAKTSADNMAAAAAAEDSRWWRRILRSIGL